jgi:DNA-binding IclR family transcriptional regulator
MTQDRVEAVERALAILGAFDAAQPRRTLADLAAATGLYKSTILRLAGSLEHCGYLLRQDDGAWRLGPALGRLGTVYRSGFDLADAIRPELARLVEATRETASFYVRDGDSRVCLYRQNSPQAARHHLDEGAQLPLTAGASARILMAFTAPGDASGAAIRTQGHYVSLGERDPLVAAVSVPVFDGAGLFRGALAVSGLAARFTTVARDEALDLLRGAAARLKPALG